MKVKLTNGKIGDDGYYNYYHLSKDSGYRSPENETKVHIQATLSRLDEISFMDIISNRDYYEIVDNKRYYNLCLRCGYVTNSKQEIYENTKPKYLDAHCKCGNAMQYVDFDEDEIYYMLEQEQERLYREYLFKDLIGTWFDEKMSVDEGEKDNGE